MKDVPDLKIIDTVDSFHSKVWDLMDAEIDRGEDPFVLLRYLLNIAVAYCEYRNLSQSWTEEERRNELDV